MTKRKIYLFVAVILLMCCGIVAFAYFDNSNKEVAVKVYLVGGDESDSLIETTGTVEPITAYNLFINVNAQFEKIKVSIGSQVKKGDVLAILAPGTINTYLDQLTIDYESKKLEMERAVTKKDKELCEKKVELAKNVLNNAKTELQNINLDTGEVYSPTDGIVTALNYSEGDYASSSLLFATISSCDLKIIAKVSEEDIKKVEKGTLTDVSGSAFDGTLEGKVEKIGTFAHNEVIENVEMTVIDVEVKVTNKDSVLKQGYNVDLTMYKNDDKDTIYLNADAVQGDNTGKEYVYLVESGVAKKKYIEVEAYSDIKVKVTSGLEKGDKVILNPSSKMKENEKVKVESSTN